MRALSGVRRISTRALSILWPGALVLVAWQLLVSHGDYDAIVIPSPVAVARDLVTSPGAYLADTLETLIVAVAGLVTGLLAGTVAAVLAWSSRVLSGLVTPVAVALYAVPTLAFIPVIAQVVGYNHRTIVVVASLVSFFPAFVYGVSGLSDLPAGSRAVFAALGARHRSVLLRLALPAAVGRLLVALRVSAATCVVAAVVAEYLMGTDGLGQAFVYHYRRFETERAFGIAVVVMVVSFATYSTAGRIERWGNARLS